MPVVPEPIPVSRPKTPRKSIPPIPSRLSLPEFGRPPSRIEGSDRQRLSSPRSYFPHGIAHNAIRIPRNVSNQVTPNVQRTRNPAPPVRQYAPVGKQQLVPMGRESKPPPPAYQSQIPPPASQGLQAPPNQPRPPLKVTHKPTQSAPKSSPHYRTGEPTPALSQAERIVDQRIRHHQTAAPPHGPHPLPETCAPVSPMCQHPLPPTQHRIHVSPYAQAAYRPTSVIPPPIWGEMMQGGLAQIGHELAQPPNPMFNDLLEKRAIGRHPALGGWHPITPPSPIDPARQAQRSEAQCAKDDETYRSRVTHANIPQYQ